MSEERRDLFGRTIVELVGAIARQRRRLEIADGYSGNEGIALNKERMRSNIRVDERQLAEMRGEPVARDEPIVLLKGDALTKWRSDLGYRCRPYEQLHATLRARSSALGK